MKATRTENLKKGIKTTKSHSPDTNLLPRPRMLADEDDGGGYATVSASRRAARRRTQQTDYRALHTGKPTRQRIARATTVSDLPSDTTLDDVIGLLNIIII